VAADAFIVVDDIAASVQDRSAAVKLDRPRMVRGVSVNYVNASVDQPVRELYFTQRDGIAPVGSPMHRYDRDVAAALVRQHLRGYLLGNIPHR
jgi:hypothetical protein